MSGVRVLHVLPGLTIGGLETVVLDLARHARAAGHDDRLLLFDTARVDAGTDLDPGDTPVTCVPRRRGLDPGCVLRIARQLRRTRPQALHAHNDTALCYAAAARRLLGTGAPRLVATFHNLPVHATARARWATRLACRTARAVTAVSEDLGTRLRGAGWTPACEVVTNGVDLRRFAPAAAPRPTAQPLQVGMLARAVPGKRHDLLLDAVAQLQHDGVAIRLTVGGDGPGAVALAAAVARLRDARHLRQVGDPAAFLRGLDVLVLLSDHEGAPRTVLEAMATGLPVVASAVGGLPELTGDAALLVPNHVAAVASALRARRDPARRAELGARARRHVAAHHDLEQVAARYAAIYRR